MTTTTKFEIWAQLILSSNDSDHIRNFCINELRIDPKKIIRNLHLTVYHSRRPMPGVIPLEKNIHLVLPINETRFMVMAPGGENPRPDIDPQKHKIGIRIQRRSSAMPAIIEFRNEITKFETSKVLGKRLPSNKRRNAFGSRYFQPHIAILRTGKDLENDLTNIGNLFRERLGNITFDRYIIDVVPAKRIAKNQF